MTFSVEARGDGLSYRWLRNGAELASATSSTYSLATISKSDNQSSFSVRISNAGGAVTSEQATLTVQPPMSNTLQYFTGDTSPNFRGTSLLPISVTSPQNHDGLGQESAFVLMSGLAADQQGNVYVAQDYAVRKILANGLVTTVTGQLNISTGAYIDGNAADARFNVIRDIVVDRVGNIYVADSKNFAIRRISKDGVVSTVAGGPGKQGNQNGTVSEATFSDPTAVAINREGDLYVIDKAVKVPNKPEDQPYFLIRKISANGVVMTVPGGVLDANARNVTDIALDEQGNIYLSVAPADFFFSILGSPPPIVVAYVLKITPQGVSSVLAGSTQRNALGAVDGPGGIARFQSPSKLDIDASGNLYLVDYRAIRRVSPEGVVSTAVGILGSATVFPTELPLGNLPQAIIFSNSIAVSPDGTVYLNSRLPLPGYGGCEVILKAEPL